MVTLVDDGIISTSVMAGDSSEASGGRHNGLIDFGHGEKMENY
jgi:hypothetical protein